MDEKFKATLRQIANTGIYAVVVGGEIRRYINASTYEVFKREGQLDDLYLLPEQLVAGNSNK